MSVPKANALKFRTFYFVDRALRILRNVLKTFVNINSDIFWPSSYYSHKPKKYI